MQFLSANRSHDISLQKSFLNREHLAVWSFFSLELSVCVIRYQVLCVCKWDGNG